MKIAIRTQLSEEDYIIANFKLYYHQWKYKILTFIGISIFAYTIITYSPFNRFPVYEFVFSIFLIIGFPIQLYHASKKIYAHNKKVSELILYEIESDSLIITGESYYNKIEWDRIYGYTELQDWFYLWQSSKLVSIIPKRDITLEYYNGLKEKLELHNVTLK